MSQARVCSNVILCFSQIHIWNYEIPTQLKSTVKQFYRFTKLDYSSNCSLAPVFWQLSDSAASIPSQSIQYFFFFFGNIHFVNMCLVFQDESYSAHFNSLCKVEAKLIYMHFTFKKLLLTLLAYLLNQSCHRGGQNDDQMSHVSEKRARL